MANDVLIEYHERGNDASLGDEPRRRINALRMLIGLYRLDFDALAGDR